MGAKLFRIRVDKVGGFIRVCDCARYLVLLRVEKYKSICNRVRYIIEVKNGIT